MELLIVLGEELPIKQTLEEMQLMTVMKLRK